MPVQLVVLGKSPSWPDRGGAGSGYLARIGELRLLIDCGSGIFAKLRGHEHYERIDAVVLSHLHADHMLDLAPFAYALRYGPGAGRSTPAVHVPPGGRAALRQLGGAFSGPDIFEQAFELHEYDIEAELAIGEARIRFCPVPHYVPTNAIELRSARGGGRLVFSADCGPNDVLAPFARDAQLLLIESTLLEAEPAQVGGPPPGHLSAAQAGAIGREARAERLVLTHFSDELDAALLRERAAAAFGGPVELASEGAGYEV